ncbi:MAG: radical SAM protein [Nitrospira sp.]|nr:MAG: radical SAM protein [Nitrospira sp.]
MKQLDRESYLAAVTSKALQTRRPEGVTFELTYGCNFKCVHCYNPTHRALPYELTTSEICEILNQIADLGVLTVTFTGGEPSVRPDIDDILRHARQQGLIIHLMTNATRITPSFTDLLHEVGVSQIEVSIYGATETVYEQMTAIPGSYRQFRQGLLNLAAAALPVVVRMPVTTINHEEIQACRQLVESLYMKFQYCLEIMTTITGDRTPLQYRLASEEKVRIDQELLPHRWTETSEESCSNNPFIECACGQSRFAITPYGEMNLCTAFPIPRYNLRAGSVKEGWEMLKLTVDQAHPSQQYECPTCDARPHCRQGRSDAWLETGDMSSCLPHYKEWAQLEHHTHALLDPRRPR